MTTKQFDVVPNPTRRAREQKPYLVCVQHHRLDHMRTRVMAPLLPQLIAEERSRLHPAFDVAGKRYYLDPADLAAFRLDLLDDPVANLEHDRDTIIAALDLVFTGI